MVSQAELFLRGYHPLVRGLISIFLETVWVPLIVICDLYMYEILCFMFGYL